MPGGEVLGAPGVCESSPESDGVFWDPGWDIGKRRVLDVPGWPTTSPPYVVRSRVVLAEVSVLLEDLVDRVRKAGEALLPTEVVSCRKSSRALGRSAEFGARQATTISATS